MEVSANEIEAFTETFAILALWIETLKMLVVWDYENHPIGHLTPLQVRQHVCDCVGERSMRFHAYGDTTQMAKSRASLHRAGWTIVDCPHKQNKQSADAKIIFDVLVDPTDLVLISGDGDFVSLLCAVRDKGFKTWLLYDEKRQHLVHADLIRSANASFGIGSVGDEEDESDDKIFVWAVSQCTKEGEDDVLNTDVGELFHDAIRGVCKEKATRKLRYRAAQKRAIDSGRMTKTEDGTRLRPVRAA